MTAFTSGNVISARLSLRPAVYVPLLSFPLHYLFAPPTTAYGYMTFLTILNKTPIVSSRANSLGLIRKILQAVTSRTTMAFNVPHSAGSMGNSGLGSRAHAAKFMH